MVRAGWGGRLGSALRGPGSGSPSDPSSGRDRESRPRHSAPYLEEGWAGGGGRCGLSGWLPGWQLRAGPNQEERSSPPSSRAPPPSLFLLLLRLRPRFLPAPLYLSGTFADYLLHSRSLPAPSSPGPPPAPREDKLVKGRVVPGEGPAPVGVGRAEPGRKGTAGGREEGAGQGSRYF